MTQWSGKQGWSNIMGVSDSTQCQYPGQGVAQIIDGDNTTFWNGHPCMYTEWHVVFDIGFATAPDAAVESVGLASWRTPDGGLDHNPSTINLYACADSGGGSCTKIANCSRTMDAALQECAVPGGELRTSQYLKITFPGGGTNSNYQSYISEVAVRVAAPPPQLSRVGNTKRRHALSARRAKAQSGATASASGTAASAHYPTTAPSTSPATLSLHQILWRW